MKVRIFFSPDTPCAEADTLPPPPKRKMNVIGLDLYSFPAPFKLEFFGLVLSLLQLISLCFTTETIRL